MPGGVPAPKDRPTMPCFLSNGKAARVQPGTSRWGTDIGGAKPTCCARTIRTFISGYEICSCIVKEKTVLTSLAIVSAILSADSKSDAVTHSKLIGKRFGTL